MYANQLEKSISTVETNGRCLFMKYFPSHWLLFFFVLIDGCNTLSDGLVKGLV